MYTVVRSVVWQRVTAGMSPDCVLVLVLVRYPPPLFFFCFRFILPVMSCPNEMLIFTEISFLLMFAVTTYLLPSCLEISAL